MTPERLISVLHEEVIYAHLLHETFFQVFDSTEDVTRLLEDSDEQFFLLINSIYLDAIPLSFTRLLDPAKTGSKDNLSLFYLIEQTSLSAHNDFGKWLSDLKTIREAAQKFFDARNKVTGHLDLVINANRASIPRPSFSRTDIQEIYHRITTWLNEVRLGLGLPYCSYNIGVANFQYARPLLLTLGEGRKSLNQKAAAGQVPKLPSDKVSPYS